MSSYVPTAIPATRRNIARRPALGQEFLVSLSPDPTLELAVIEMPAANSGLIEKDPVFGLGLAAVPADLVAVVIGDLNGSGSSPVVLTLSVTDADNVVGNAVATFAPPAWVNNQTTKFGEGYAVDLVVASGKKVKAINHVVSISGGGEMGNKIKILQPPELSTFMRVGYTTQKDFSTKSRPPVAIPDNEDGSKSIKRGRSKPGEITVTAKGISQADGLARFSGKNCSVLVDVKKEQSYVTDRLLFGNAVLEVDPKAGDGEDHAEQTATGMFEHFASFFAP